MTICNAALADNSQAIVCIADKGISYGETIQWDSDSSKIMQLGSRNVVVMMAGMDSHITRFLAPILEVEDQIGHDVQKTIKMCEAKYKEVYDELIYITFLRPRLITPADYLKGISGEKVNEFFRQLLKEIDAFVVNCALLLCGFDDNGKPFIISLVAPGIATDYSINGFHAIGTGSDKAISKILYSEFNRKNPIERILYDCFDAKAFAEMDPTIGYEWDTKIVTADKIWPVSPETTKLVESVWSKFNRSPFEKRKKGDLRSPSKDWHATLNLYFSRMTNRIPNGKMRTLTVNGMGPIEDQPPDFKKKVKLVKQVLEKQVKPSVARKSKRGR